MDQAITVPSISKILSPTLFKEPERGAIALAEMGRLLESIPADLAAVVDGGRIPVEIVRRFGELEKSAVARWFMQFAGFRERLMVDELFLLKLNMECGVGIFTKVLTNIIEVKLRRNVLSVLEAPTGLQDDDELDSEPMHWNGYDMESRSKQARNNSSMEILASLQPYGCDSQPFQGAVVRRCPEAFHVTAIR